MSTVTTLPWPEVPIGDVLTYLDERIALDDASEYITITVKRRHGGLEQRERILGHRIQTKKQFRLVPGAFIISRVQCWHQAYAIVPDDIPLNMIASINYDQFAISPKVDRRFFWWLSHSPYFTETVRSSAFGVVIEKMVFNRGAWLAKKIPLPPLEEQRRIVARVEALAAKVSEARFLRLQADEEAEALSYALLRQKRGELLDSSHPKASLGSVSKVTSGGTPSRDNPAFWNGEIPWVKTGELLDGDISSTEEHITQSGLTNSSAKIFPPETVLVALYGQGQTRGRTGRLLIPAATNQACCAILPNPQKFEPRYIQFWLRSLYVELREAGKGGAQPNWNGTMIKNLEVVLPPLAEQRRVVAYLDDLQKRAEGLKALRIGSSAELDALMPSILGQAFGGGALTKIREM